MATDVLSQWVIGDDHEGDVVGDFLIYCNNRLIIGSSFPNFVSSSFTGEGVIEIPLSTFRTLQKEPLTNLFQCRLAN